MQERDQAKTRNTSVEQELSDAQQLLLEGAAAVQHLTEAAEQDTAKAKADHHAAMDALESELTTMQAEHTELTAHLAEAEAEIAALTTDLESYERASKMREESRETVPHNVQQLEQEVIQLQAKLQQVEQAAQEAEEQHEKDIEALDMASLDIVREERQLQGLVMIKHALKRLQCSSVASVLSVMRQRSQQHSEVVRQFNGKSGTPPVKQSTDSDSDEIPADVNAKLLASFQNSRLK